MIKLFHKDCLSAMIQMPDNFFDLAIVDPPYGIGNWVQTSGNLRGKAIKWNNNIPPKKYFIELHHGKISVSSELGKGTTFMIQLKNE